MIQAYAAMIMPRTLDLLRPLKRFIEIINLFLVIFFVLTPLECLLTDQIQRYPHNEHSLHDH